MRKVKCSDYGCGWTGLENEILEGLNPFDETEEVSGCPECKQINTIIYACDEPLCWNDVTCGTATERGYRSTCGKHVPKDNK